MSSPTLDPIEQNARYESLLARTLEDMESQEFELGDDLEESRLLSAAAAPWHIAYKTTP